jgi:hypothetical protein
MTWLKGIAPTGNRERAKIHAVTADRVAACGADRVSPFPSGVQFDAADPLACRACAQLVRPPAGR